MATMVAEPLVAAESAALEVSFEALIEKDVSTGYIMTNEDPAIWRKLTAGKRLDRVGAICSGGEVGFFSLLPSVREELVLVDHSTTPLHCAMLKYLLLRKHGIKACLELFQDESKLYSELETLREFVPEHVLKRRYSEYSIKSSISEHSRMESRVVSIRGKDGQHGGRQTGMSSIWGKVSDYERKQVEAKLDKVRFVHGDFVSLEQYAPFDLFYISNAAEHGNGNTKAKDLDDFSKRLLKKGSYVLCSTKLNIGPKVIKRWDAWYKKEVEEVNTYNAFMPDNWKLVEEAPYENTGNSGWKYCLYQVVK